MSDQLNAPDCVCCFRNTKAFRIKNEDRIRKHGDETNKGETIT